MLKFNKLKALIIPILLVSSLQTYGQNICFGKYSTHYGETFFLHADSTFKFLNGYPRNQWAKGTWRTCKDTIYFKFVPIYDTLRVYNNNNILINESFVLSCDEHPSLFKCIRTNSNLLEEDEIKIKTCVYKQDGGIFPQKLLFRKKRLYEFDDLGKPIIRNYRSVFTNAKFKSGYFYKEKCQDADNVP